MGRWGWRGWGLAAAVVVGITAVAFGQDSNPPKQSLDGAPGSVGAPAEPAYDVVSVKAVAAGTRMEFMGVRNEPDGIDAENVTLAVLVRAAFGGLLKLPTDDSVTGLPEWGKAEYFNVQARMSPEQTAAFAKMSKDDQEQQREAMLQALLADRFKLKVHRVTRQVPDYELVVAKGGPKLKEGGGDNPNAPKGRDGKPMAGTFMILSSTGKVTAQQFTMTALANFLSQPMVGVGRVVMNKTGLTGNYDFVLNFSPPQGIKAGPNAGASPSPGPDDENPSIFTALQEDLGLKLHPGTGTIDTVVVDQVERASVD